MCANGTSGGCLSPVTHECVPFNAHGVCPRGYAPCQSNPCTDVRAPCFNPRHESCAPKSADDCRLVDASGTVCVAHACEPGHVENVGTRWQQPFYRDPTDYTLGLYDQHFDGNPTPRDFLHGTAPRSTDLHADESTASHVPAWAPGAFWDPDDSRAWTPPRVVFP